MITIIERENREPVVMVETNVNIQLSVAESIFKRMWLKNLIGYDDIKLLLENVKNKLISQS